ncbi:MAG: DUF4331 family protein [Polyangiaceae bacterium]
MKNTHLLFTALAAIAAAGVFSLAGCSGDDTSGTGPGTDSGTVGDTGPGTDSGKVDAGPPAPPTLGTQIDRMGRPAINTALNHAFDIDATAKGNAKDAYNQDTGESGWQLAYTPQFAVNLGILDSLDTLANASGGPTSCIVPTNGCGCGNQLGFSASQGYVPLAGLLADDRLYVNTAPTTCLAYLAVEANALNIQPNADCGGRRLGDDIIDTTYSAATGIAFGDGVSAPGSAPLTTFPYLADPH